MQPYQPHQQPPNYPPQTANPYAAPQMGYTAALSRADGYSMMVKWVHLGLYCFGIFGVVAIAIGSSQGRSGEVVAQVGTACAVIGLYGPMICGLVWLYKSWNLIPAGWRVTRNQKRISPGEAVGFMFVPCYNLYWIFIANMGLCDALDQVLYSSGSPTRAPRGLAVAACVFHLLPYVNILLGPIMWFIFMHATDRTKREVLAILEGGQVAPGY